ncbi:uncharacterized protein LOC134656022 [Cydia amplana]|uniref:uncharacterized protein LOC134656022 n=1 Tax=Cydia amplana TaxID=1869771 RepID=UPI002FE69B5C
MDPERQPLLSDLRCRRVRALTFDEVLAVRQNSIWRRCRLILILIFWATIAMFLSMITCLLLKTQCRPELSSVKGIPPVHLTMAPLIASTRADAYIL